MPKRKRNHRGSYTDTDTEPADGSGIQQLEAAQTSKRGRRVSRAPADGGSHAAAASSRHPKSNVQLLSRLAPAKAPAPADGGGIGWHWMDHDRSSILKIVVIEA